MLKFVIRGFKPYSEYKLSIFMDFGYILGGRMEQVQSFELHFRSNATKTPKRGWAKMEKCEWRSVGRLDPFH